MPTDYEYDVFISYRNEAPIRPWVENHFYPQLSQWLRAELSPAHNSKVFVDWDSIEVGDTWPERLRRALAASRCLVCVWAPQYFSSPWCRAELATIMERERLLGMRSPSQPKGLFYPVVFSDGRHFPAEIHAIQSRDLSRFNFPQPVFGQSPQYLGFVEQIKNMAAELAEMVETAPAWDDWPVITPSSVGAPRAAQLPRL
jgi:hypothetical protein